MSNVSLSISPSRSASQPTVLSGDGNVVVSHTLTFYGWNGTAATRTASLAFASPDAPATTRDGYVFLGYYTQSEGGTQIYDENLNCIYSVWPFVEDMTLYAQWVRLSNISFVSEGNTVGTAVAQKGKALPSAPEATKQYYGFLGYFTSENGGTKVYDENRNPVQSSWNSTEDVTLYAQWEPVSVPFTVTLISDGATVGTVNARQSYAIESVSVPTKEDYGFRGYWTAATGGDKVFNDDGTPVASKWTRYEDLTLYAHWEPVSVPFTVTLVSDGSTIGSINARQSYAVEPVSVPAKESHKFRGYWTTATGGEKVFNEDGTPVAATWTRYEDWTLHAHWESAYTFTFVSGDATVGTASYGESDTATAPVAQRTGDYIFLGYFTENGVQVFDGSGALIPGSLPGLSTDATLYAHWAPPEGSIVKLVYRGQLTLLGTDTPATDTQKYTKKMHFRVYDSSESTTPLWTTGEGGIDVTVNKDGSFVQVFGDDTLAELLATGTVTHVGLAIGDSAVELKPRRELRPVAAVNHALTAEGAALDIRIGNLVTDNALVAADATVSQLEVTGRVTAPGAGEVAVSPLTVGDRERTRLMRGAGVKAFSAAKPTVLVADTGAKLRGEVIATAPSDGMALITSKAGGERALRCPAVVQYCRAGESVRAPTSEAGGLKVTFFPFIGKEGR